MSVSPISLPLIGLVPFKEALELSEKGNPTIYPWIDWPYTGEETCAIAQNYAPDVLARTWYRHLSQESPSIFIDWYQLETRQEVRDSMLSTFVESHSSFELSDLARIFSL